MRLWKSYKILIERQAQKFLKSLASAEYDSIVAKIYMLNTDQSCQLDIKKLQGFDKHYRIRIGNFRIVFVVLSNNQLLIVSLIEHRKIIYQLLKQKFK